MSSIYFKYENIAACLKIVEENNKKKKILSGRKIKNTENNNSCLDKKNLAKKKIHKNQFRLFADELNINILNAYLFEHQKKRSKS